MTDMDSIRTSMRKLTDTTRSVSNAARAIQKKRPDGVESEVADLLDAVVELQSNLMDLQGDLDEVRDAIEEAAAKKIPREDYERRKVGNGWVYVPKGEDEPMLCPSCFDDGSLSYLVLEAHSTYDPTKLLNCHRCGISIRRDG